MKVSELDPGRTVYKTKQNDTVHLNKNCRHISDVTAMAAPAGNLFRDLTVCSNCDPNHNFAETMRESFGIQDESIGILENADPDDFP